MNGKAPNCPIAGIQSLLPRNAKPYLSNAIDAPSITW